MGICMAGSEGEKVREKWVCYRKEGVKRNDGCVKEEKDEKKERD